MKLVKITRNVKFGTECLVYRLNKLNLSTFSPQQLPGEYTKVSKNVKYYWQMNYNTNTVSRHATEATLLHI